MNYRALSALAGTLVLLTLNLPAADYFCTPAGAGKKDGSSWENAAGQEALAGLVSGKLQAGDRLQIGSGQYTGVNLKIARGGTEGKPVTLTGVDRGSGLPVFSSSWSIEKPDKGPTFLDLAPGASSLVVQHLRVKNYCFVVRAAAAKEGAAPEAPRQHLVFEDLKMEQFRHGFYLAYCQDVRMENCELKRYSKHAFRWDQGCQHVVVRRCSADCTEGDAVWESQTELFPFGFTINSGGEPNTNFQFEDCLSQNNRKSNQTIKYTNGDGYSVEANTVDVSFLRCRSFHNQDGGFDLKVDKVKLTDCVSSGQRRDYRIWHTGTLVNCFGGWSQTGLWCKSGGVTAQRCTFHDEQHALVEGDTGAKEPIVLEKCLLSSVSVAPKAGVHPKPPVELKDSAVEEGNAPGAATRFAGNDPKWNGLGPAMDYRARPDVGYHAPK